MRQLTINTSKTPKGYCASCDLIPGWVVAYEGDFPGFEDYVLESIRFYVDCAKADGEFFPEILAADDLVLSYKFDVQSLLAHYQNIFSFAALQYSPGSTNASCGTTPPDVPSPVRDRRKKSSGR